MASVNDLIQDLNDHGFTDTGTPRKVALINDTIADIAARKPWPFLVKSLDLTFDGSSAVPTNFPDDFRAALSLINPDGGRIIVPERLHTVEKVWGTEVTESGEAFLYYFVGTQLNVVRIPSASTTLRLRYFHVPAEVTDSSDEADIIIPRQHHRAITLGVLQKLYDMEDDPELAVRFEQHYEARIQRMEHELMMQQYDRPQVVHVIDEDDDWFL